MASLDKWKANSLTDSALDQIENRGAEGRSNERCEGPKKPQCKIDTWKEALRSSITLREMLRDRTASANATWLEERQEPVQRKPSVDLEENPVP